MFLVFFFSGCLLALLGEGTCSAIKPGHNATTTFPRYVLHQDKVTWTEARSLCELDDMFLAYIKNDEQKHLKKYLSDQNLLRQITNSSYWLGARGRNNTWRWSGFDDSEVDFSGWSKQDEKVVTETEYQCMKLQYNNTNKFNTFLSWNRVGCNERRGYICRVLEGTYATIKPYHCPCEVATTTKPRYVLHEDKETWVEARKVCEKDGMFLAYIKNSEDQKHLKKFIRDHNLLPTNENSGYWLGARGLNNTWRWNGFDDSEVDFSGWSKQDEKVVTQTEYQCMELQYINTNQLDRSLSWNSVVCNEKRGYICRDLDGDNQ